MNIGTTGRGCNHEEQIGRFIIEAFVIDALTDNHRRQAWRRYGVGLGVGNRYAFTDSRTAFFFPGKDTGLVGCRIFQMTALFHQSHEMIDSPGFISSPGLQINTFFF